MRNYLTEKGIKIIHPFSEKKASVCERFNRTFQDLIYRFATEKESYRYIDVLYKLLSTYNNRGHRTLKYMTPNEAEKKENHNKVMNALNEHYTKAIRAGESAKYKIGQKVLIRKLPERFARGYHERFLIEHFEIVKINSRLPIPMYILKSLNNNEIVEGGFYGAELSPIKVSSFKMTVLKTRRYRGRLQYFVNWRGYDESHNTWIDADNITNSDLTK